MSKSRRNRSKADFLALSADEREKQKKTLLELVTWKVASQNTGQTGKDIEKVLEQQAKAHGEAAEAYAQEAQDVETVAGA